MLKRNSHLKVRRTLIRLTIKQLSCCKYTGFIKVYYAVSKGFSLWGPITETALVICFFFFKGTKSFSSSQVIRKLKRNVVTYLSRYIFMNSILYQELEKSLIVELKVSVKHHMGMWTLPKMAINIDVPTDQITYTQTDYRVKTSLLCEKTHLTPLRGNQ